MNPEAPAKAPWQDWSADDLATERKRRENLGRMAANAAPKMAREDRLMVAGLATLRCTPENSASDVPHVFVHGGGWVFGSSQQSLGLIRRLAAGSRRPILSLDYPLAPEHPYPQAINAVATALDALSAGPGFAGLIGASAGAQIALHAMAASDGRKAAAAVLFCGAFRQNSTAWSHKAFGAGEGRLTTDAMQDFLSAHAAPPELPLPDAGCLPPLFLQVGDADPLLADTLEAYAHYAGRQAGDRLEVIPGATHGYMNDWHLDARIDWAIESALGWMEICVK